MVPVTSEQMNKSILLFYPNYVHILCLILPVTTEQRTGQDTEKATRTGGIYELEPAEGGKKSGHGKKRLSQGALTNWTSHSDRQARTQKETD